MQRASGTSPDVGRRIQLEVLVFQPFLYSGGRWEETDETNISTKSTARRGDNNDTDRVSGMGGVDTLQQGNRKATA